MKTFIFTTTIDYNCRIFLKIVLFTPTNYLLYLFSLLRVCVKYFPSSRTLDTSQMRPSTVICMHDKAYCLCTLFICRVIRWCRRYFTLSNVTYIFSSVASHECIWKKLLLPRWKMQYSRVRYIMLRLFSLCGANINATKRTCQYKVRARLMTKTLINNVAFIVQ